MNSGLSLFEGFGVELEYMIVDEGDLTVRPIADKLLQAAAGEIISDFENGEIAWSNELALHVVELKTNGPADTLFGLANSFQRNVEQINGLLRPLAARLMPSAMHPWMDPALELQLWPHDSSPVYEAFHRIFDCRGHGWANLQSVHLNLPFADDAEFARLHAAIRLMLPILPALAASSPLLEGQLTRRLDNRLELYRHNARRIPSVTGQVIPEAVFDQQSYQERILQKMYADIAPHDPAGVLQYEWLNARGAIARWERNTIEIRIIDVQECPQADLAICAAIVEVLKALVDKHWTAWSVQKNFSTDALERILLSTIQDADEAVITDVAYLQQFGYPIAHSASGVRVRAHDLWRWTLDSLGMFQSRLEAAWGEPLRVILDQGPLARRIVKSLGGDLSRSRLVRLYGQLCDCLASGNMFHVE